MASVPTRQDADRGARLALENAIGLLEASRVLGERRDFGPGTSLAVLAGEESIKALALMAWHAELPIPTEKQLGLVLRQHEPRYLAAGMLLGAGELLTSIMAGLLAALSRGAGVETTQQRVGLSRAAWWADANERKNRGFYVEFAGDKWALPANITNEEFNRAYDEAKYVVDFVQGTFTDGLKAQGSTEPGGLRAGDKR